MNDLPALESALRRHRPLRLPARRRFIRAAVAVVVAPGPDGPQVLLTRRARRAGDPWSGDVSFPGGRLSTGDAGGGAAACREAFEETGLVLTETDRIGRLHDRLTRAHGRPLPMVVSPFVYRYPEQAGDLDGNHEVAEIFWLPLSVVVGREHRRTFAWRVGPLRVPMPSRVHQGQTVWGLTLMMLGELARVAGRAGG
ncbi:CoA pyrophosphatase [Salinisphaera sp. P385]|uniref:CoA pyrophosphatase n=1 Tax=Spectribacter acetivorans TaxID=3075603 RepID=A0ABU3B7D7_9GAMM|nr:CoA pyrophosphatase [Salinisphaera sp. P385]MDT0618149.1 CoA pyrophosphatase [Salinisphaera sp. P385]